MRRYLTTVGAAAIVFLAGLATVQAESSAVPVPPFFSKRLYSCK